MAMYMYSSHVRAAFDPGMVYIPFLYIVAIIYVYVWHNPISFIYTLTTNARCLSPRMVVIRVYV